MIGPVSQFIPPPYLDWLKVGHLPRWAVRYKKMLAWFSSSSEALTGQGEYGCGPQNLCSLFVLPSQHWPLREGGTKRTSGRPNLIKPPEAFLSPELSLDSSLLLVTTSHLPVCTESPKKEADD